MTGPESVVLPLHHSPMIYSCRKDDAKVELNFLSAKKNRCFFTFSFYATPKSTSDAPEHPPAGIRPHRDTPCAARHTITPPVKMLSATHAPTSKTPRQAMQHHIVGISSDREPTRRQGLAFFSYFCHWKLRKECNLLEMSIG